MESINYSKSLELNVSSVDNQLVVSLNQDVPGGAKSAEIYRRSVSGFASGVADTVDLTQTIASIGGSAVLTAVASNFANSGNISFKLIADGKVAYEKNQSFKEYTSQQWALSIKQK